MTRNIRILPDAEAELASAADWYEQRRPGLGIELAAAADDAIERLRKLPDSGSPWKTGHSARKFRLPRFPYFIVYRVRGTSLEIVAFAHQKRRPGYWRTK